MSFTFDWPRFSDQFHYDAIQMLNTALNKGNKPPIIADKIEVVELEMGTQPPELEIRDIGDLTLDQFRGIFRLTYAGDAHLVLKTKVQANPLNHKQPDIHLMGGSRGMLAAKQPLVVPMLLRLSHFRLSSYVVLVVSKQKGITLVFKTDPLQHVDINSTFDSIAVIQSFIQREIEGQLRQMFREDLPGIIHRLSQQWVKAKVEAPYQNRIQVQQQQTRQSSKKPSLSSLSSSRRPRAFSHSSSNRPSFPSSASSSFSTAPSSPGTSITSDDKNKGDSSPTPSSHPELENFDPTYGLRPEGLPTKSGFKAFSSLFTPNKGLADLAEESRSTVDELEYDEDEGDETEQYDDDDAFDIVDWDDRHSLFTKEKESQPPPVEYETIPAVGGGTITRPRVYHSQSAIQGTGGGSSSATFPQRRTYSSGGYNPYFPDTPNGLLPSALPPAAPGTAGPSQHHLQMSRRWRGPTTGPPDHISQLSRSNTTDSESLGKEAIYMRRNGPGMNGNAGYATPPPGYQNGYSYPSPYPQQHSNGYSNRSRPRRSSITSNITTDSMATTRNGSRTLNPSESASNHEDDVEDLEEPEHHHYHPRRNGFDDYGNEDGFLYNSRSSSPPFPPPGSSTHFNGHPTSPSSSHMSILKGKQRQVSSSSQPNPSTRPPFKLNLAASAASIHQLSTLSTSNHTLSPYTRDLSHFTVRSVPPRSLSLSTSASASAGGTSRGSVVGVGVGVAAGIPSSGAGAGTGTSKGITAGRMHVGLGGLGYGPGRRFGYGGAGLERQPVPVKAKRKRTFRIGNAAKKVDGNNGEGGNVNANENNKKKVFASKNVNAYGEEFDVSDMDRYFTHEREITSNTTSTTTMIPNANESQPSTIRVRPSAARGARSSLLGNGSTTADSIAS